MTTETNFIFDLTNPKTEMLTRAGENPVLAVLATTEDHNDLVLQALTKIRDALVPIMDPDSIFLVLENRVELQSGAIIELNPAKLLLSLVYPTATGRMLEITLDPEQRVTLH